MQRKTHEFDEQTTFSQKVSRIQVKEHSLKPVKC